MSDDEQIESQMRAILDGWSAPVDVTAAERFFALCGRAVDDETGPYIGRAPAGWLVVGSYAGRDYAGCRDDGLALAEDWVRMVTPRNPEEDIIADAPIPDVTPSNDLGELTIETPDADQMEHLEAEDLPAEEYESAYAEATVENEVHLPEGSDGQDEASGGLAGPYSLIYETADDVGLSDPALDAAGDTLEPRDDAADLDGEALACDIADEQLAAGGDDGAGDVAAAGTMILGDELATAKAIALMRVDDERFERVGAYDKPANQARLDELHQIQQAIREGVHPAFTENEQDELNALETFLPFYQRIDDYAQGLRDAIRVADSVAVVQAIELSAGWPD